MQTISINFIVPQRWHELSDKQLHHVYQLIADNFTTDDKQCQQAQSGACSGYAECSRQVPLVKVSRTLSSQVIDLEALLAAEWLSPELLSALRSENLRGTLT